jgi:hypothetical protein
VAGRLIFPVLAELYRLDPTGMAADPDGPGSQVSGLDPDFHEPVVHDVVLDRGRRELPPVRVECQVEPQRDEQLYMTPAGNVPVSRISLVLHAHDLDRRGLLDRGTGRAHLTVGDRLSGLFDLTGAVLHVVRTPPGLYLTEVRPIGFGLRHSRPTRNLFLATFEDRPQASRRTA